MCHENQAREHPYLRSRAWLEVFGCGEVGREPLFGFFGFEGDFVEELRGTADVSYELIRR
jgi:hypothetical protein